MCGADNDPVLALSTEPRHGRLWLQVGAHEAIICVGECAVDAVESNPRVLVSELSPSGHLDNVSGVVRLCFDRLGDNQFVQVDVLSKVSTAIPTAIVVGVQSVCIHECGDRSVSTTLKVAHYPFKQSSTQEGRITTNMKDHVSVLLFVAKTHPRQERNRA
jgi:hypothetical protein